MDNFLNVPICSRDQPHSKQRESKNRDSRGLSQSLGRFSSSGTKRVSCGRTRTSVPRSHGCARGGKTRLLAESWGLDSASPSSISTRDQGEPRPGGAPWNDPNTDMEGEMIGLFEVLWRVEKCAGAEKGFFSWPHNAEKQVGAVQSSTSKSSVY